MPMRSVRWWNAWLWLVVVIPWAADARTPLLIEPTAVVSLDTVWAFQHGDKMAWAAPDFEDSEWSRRPLLSGFDAKASDSHLGWFRKTLVVTGRQAPISEVERASWHLGVRLGKINSAYEIYAGGQRLGGVGALPPEPRIDYDRHAIFAIPATAIDADGRIVLALRVWAAPATLGRANGPREGIFEVGPIEHLVHQEAVAELSTLFLGGWFFILGLTYFELYRRRRKWRSYLWFALLASSFGVYVFLRTQWKYALGIDFVVLKEVEHLTCYINTALLIQLVWPLLGVPIGRVARGVQITLLAAGLIGLTPGLTLNLIMLPFWQITVVAVLLAALALITHAAWRGQPGARTLAAGCLLAAAFLIHDVLVDRGLIDNPRLVAFGFATFVTTLAITLAQRFVRLQTEVEDLRRSEEANRLKSDFLANMSHELRTPITGILGTSDLLQRLDLPRRGVDYANVIRSSAQSLLAIVDDVLDFSKVEAGHLSLERVAFPPRETVQGVVDLLTPRARAKGLELTLSLDPRLPRQVEGDPLRLRQVLLNLVGNAVKFTTTGGVTVGVEVLGDTGRTMDLRFSVSDTGIGIDPADLERLFLPFTQADSSTTRRFGGTGLGLSISRRIAEAMGGRLAATSRLGEGSVFFLDLELPTVQSADERAAIERPEVSVEAGAEVGNGMPTDSMHRVLLVEDNPVNHLVIEQQLAALGHHVTSAYDGREALDLLKDHAFDVVLMDCQMPEVDGYEVTRRVRQAEIGESHVPIIALTAHALAGDREKCLAAGMDDYLAKPFTIDQLDTLLQPWLDTSGG